MVQAEKFLHLRIIFFRNTEQRLVRLQNLKALLHQFSGNAASPAVLPDKQAADFLFFRRFFEQYCAGKPSRFVFCGNYYSAAVFKAGEKFFLQPFAVFGISLSYRPGKLDDFLAQRQIVGGIMNGLYFIIHIIPFTTAYSLNSIPKDLNRIKE